MAVPAEIGDYVTLTNVTVWWNKSTPDTIHITSDDPDLPPGDLRISVNTNPKSANYNPSVFNRLRTVLMGHGKSFPPHEAAKGDRRLDKRPKVVGDKKLIREMTTPAE